MNALDWLVLALYAALSLGLGAWAHRRQADGTSWFLGGRSLPWPLVGVSILATAFSATSLLGGPGEAYSHGFLWMQLQLGDLLAILVVAWVFIPALRGRDLVTAYEYLERRFGVWTRSLASLVFLLQVLFRAGVLVYGPALALSTLTGLPLSATIVLIGVLATLYTALGGITAVVWTDALQLLVVVAGLLISAAVVLEAMPGGWSGAMALAAEDGRTRWIDGSLPASSVRSFWGAVIGYGILSLSVAGTNQQPVQRYLSCRDVGEARRAALLGWAVGAVVSLAALFVGVLLYAYYKQHVGSLPADLAADQVFPHFIGTQLPAGVVGLLVAAILAAAMSSLDSALNSMSTATVNDFQLRLLTPSLSASDQLVWARRWTLFWGILGTLAGLYVAGRGSLLSMAVRYVGYFAGPMLGLFLLGLLTRRVGERAALSGLIAAFAGVLFLVQSQNWFGIEPPVKGIWVTSAGTLISLAVGLGTSVFWREAPVEDEER